MLKPLVSRAVFLSLSLFLLACQNPQKKEEGATHENVHKKAEAKTDLLSETLDSLATEHKTRYEFRHPKETITFFGIKPGMTVAEVLPGRGWYSKILLPYLGKSGKLIGLQYPLDLWQEFEWIQEDTIKELETWTQTWPEETLTWNDAENFAEVSAYFFDSVPSSLDSSVDSVLFIRAFHNIHRFNNKADYVSQILQATFRMLKPGGTVGIVQHEADETMPDDWSDGARGYMKKSNVIQIFEAAGFILLKESPINENPLDTPSEDDIVWRLPPSLSTSKNNQELKANYMAIGESNRMTLLFQKP